MSVHCYAKPPMRYKYCFGCVYMEQRVLCNFSQLLLFACYSLLSRAVLAKVRSTEPLSYLTTSLTPATAVLMLQTSLLENPTCVPPCPHVGLRPQLPLSLLKTAQGQPMLVELKNGDTYNGRLDNCDSWMNIKLKDVIFTSRVREKFVALRVAVDIRSTPAHLFLLCACLASVLLS